MNSFRLSIFVVLIGLIRTISAFGAEPTIKCAESIASLADDKPVLGFSALRETHSLKELISSDAAVNLAVLHPTIVMGAFQLQNAYINYVPPIEIPDPIYGASTVKLYPVFSSGLPITDGRMIVGQDQQINKYADWVQSAASGNGSG
ncbi:MAG: hypothetical protein JWQ35_2698, partial [Bacteriovoracaceae bacterium]|nr:hypothetical protein [Bacteriovoracaceae bacterium]